MQVGSLVSVLYDGVFFPGRLLPKWIQLCGKEWTDPASRLDKAKYKIWPRLRGNRHINYNVGDDILVQLRRPLPAKDGTAWVWCFGTIEKKHPNGMYSVQTNAGLNNGTMYHLHVRPGRIRPYIDVCPKQQPLVMETKNKSSTPASPRVRRSKRKRKPKMIMDL